MTENQKVNLTRSTLLGIALIVAGLAVNYFKFEIFLNLDFLFGSIFAMLALQFFGLGRGILASVIIASPTYILWNHPYAVIVMTAEVAVVGWLTDKRKIGLVLADTLYWVIIGMPLVYLFYHIFMNVPLNSAYTVMTKQAVNGITNALIARLIFTGFMLWSRSLLISYRDIIYNLLAFFVLFPALIMLIISGRADFSETDLKIRTSLLQDSWYTSHSLKNWVMNRTSVIVNLAEMAASRSPQQMQPYLELAKKSDVNFNRIGLMDNEATSTAFFPMFDELGQQNIGKNFSDRPYIPTLKRRLEPMLSEMVIGKTGTPKPMIAVLAPVVIQGEYGGYVGGILDLEQVRQRLEYSHHENPILYTLVDNKGRVIMSNRTDQAVMTQFERGKGTIHHLDAEISQWIPIVPSNTPNSVRWSKSFYVAETDIGNLAEWKLILEQPVAPFQKTLYKNFTGRLTLLFLILLVALVLAEFLSRRSIVTLENLRQSTCDISDKLFMNGKEIAWPASRIIEMDALCHNYQVMALSLRGQFNELRLTRDSLIFSEKRFRSLLQDIRSVAVQGFKPDGTTQYWNQASEQLYGYSAKEAIGQNLLELIMPPETREDFAQAIQLMAETGKLMPTSEMSRMRKDGSRIVVFSSHAMVQTPGCAPELFCVDIDLTERKLAEEHLRASLAEKEVLLKEIHHRVKNNLQIISSLISLQTDTLSDEKVQGVLSDVRGRIMTMALVHEKLYQTEDLAQLNFADYAASLLNYLWRSYGLAADKVHLNMSFVPLILQVDMAVNCGLILNELVSNAIKHAFPGGSSGEVTVVLEYDPATGTACLSVRDSGIGLPADLDWRQSSSLGLRLVQMLAGQMRGTVQTCPGSDTEFQIRFNVKGISS
jgi:two-component system cell cycle sensor histidine kinase/response regulator CckA